MATTAGGNPIDTGSILDTIDIGSIIQITWMSAVFDPEGYLKPTDSPSGFSLVNSCGYLAAKTSTFIVLALEGMYETGNTKPSFKTTLSIPIVNITNIQKLAGIFPP